MADTESRIDKLESVVQEHAISIATLQASVTRIEKVEWLIFAGVAGILITNIMGVI